MAKAKKLPSGKWRVLAYEYTDANKKRHYKSFTADTRKEAEYLAAEYISGRAKKAVDCSVFEAVDKYINIKEKVLSPSTIRGYRAILRNDFDGIGDLKLKEINNTEIQMWIGRLSEKVSPKTCRNAHGLLAATLDMFDLNFKIKTTLPAKKKIETYCPSDEDIQKLLSCIMDPELELAVLLAAFGTLRRGEICALTDKDIIGNAVSVRGSMVKDSAGSWVLKEPKTFGSYRVVEMPGFVIDKLKNREGKIIDLTPSQISDRFDRAVKRAGLPHFRFHDLRHYSASILHAIGVPDQYIMQRGGWASDHVMKSVYRNIIDLEKAKQDRKIISHFEKMQHEMQHEN